MAGHHHHHIDPNAGDQKVLWAIFVNMLLTVAQFVGGLVSGSLALIADAIHNLSDAMALVIAFAARKIARQPADEKMTFGYGRAEIVAALINYTTLIIIGFYLIYEAIMRFYEPSVINGWMIVIIAGVALVIDLITAMLTYSLSKESINIRAAFLHNVADALGSVAVIIAGALILLFDWYIIDPIVTLMIATYILWISFKEIQAVIRILMLGAPPEIKIDDMLSTIQSIDGVSGVHNIHLWEIHEHEKAFDAHIVIEYSKWKNADHIKTKIKECLNDKFDVSHTTLEIENFIHSCVVVATIKSGSAENATA